MDELLRAVQLSNEQCITDLNVKKMWQTTRGEGIKLGIIDSGICLTHPGLVHAIADTYNPTQGKISVEDVVGHGTHIAGIIAGKGIVTGVAPESKLYIAKVFEGRGGTSVHSIVKAILWCIDKDVDVISLSLGASSHVPELKQAILRAHSRGIAVIAAVGNNFDNNSNTEVLSYPSSYEEVIAVGSLDRNMKMSSFSASGKVDVVFNGHDIGSTFLNNGYHIASGTSIATPFIAGAAALYKSAYLIKKSVKLNNHQLSTLFAMNSVPLGVSKKDKVYGYGKFQF